MNFPVVPTIQTTITERVNHPAFGYFSPRKEYYQAIIKWQRTHHGITDLTSRHIGYENGVIGGLVKAMNVFCSKGDKILVHSPTYIGFTNSMKNNGYDLVLSPLVLDADSVWRMDFEDMERKLREVERMRRYVFDK